jgi:hypothetical protein
MKVMKLDAEGDKIIIRRQDVMERHSDALSKLHIPDRAPSNPGKPNPDLNVFGRIVSIGPDYRGYVPSVDPIESALIGALTAATTAGKLELVAQLAAELQARRVARETRDSDAPVVERPEPLKIGMLVVFGTAAQVKFRDGSEFVITTPGGILARIVQTEVPDPVIAHDGAAASTEAS